MWLIVGLGNPGRKYSNTRHNAGFHALFCLAHKNHIQLSRSLRARSAIGKGRIGKEKVILLQPLTFMNNSGVVIKPILKRYRIKKDKLLILCDDLNLPLGKVRLRPKGSDGGHKGLKSIISCLGTEDFSRLRIGIGSANEDKSHPHLISGGSTPLEGVHPPDKGEGKGRNLADFVLSSFNDEEKSKLKKVLKKTAGAVESLLEAGMEKTMSKFN